jgi:hypothetical protein
MRRHAGRPFNKYRDQKLFHAFAGLLPFEIFGPDFFKERTHNGHIASRIVSMDHMAPLQAFKARVRSARGHLLKMIDFGYRALAFAD